MSTLLRLGSVLLILAPAVVPPASAATINVPLDQPSIQAAMNAVNSGDEILVSPGTYLENIDFLGKNVVLRSLSGPAVTEIRAATSGPVVRFVSGEHLAAVVDGFTITNGSGTTDPWGGLSGGGIYIYQSSPTVQNNRIVANNITGGTYRRGAGISIWGKSSPTIQANEIAYNSVGTDGGNDGGGIFLRGLDLEIAPLILSNTIHHNTAFWGGGIYCNRSIGKQPTIAGNMIYANSVTNKGGGIACNVSASPVIVSCTISKNSAPSGFAGGIGTYNSTSKPVVVNCIVYGNAATQIESYAQVSYSDVQGGYSGTGNVSVDPQFVDAGNDDLHLAQSSLLIDAGNSGAPYVPALDFEGDPRIHGASIDIGADEFLPPPPPFISYGQGCPGTGGIIPTLSMDGIPLPGSTVTVHVKDGVGGGTAFIFAGLYQAAVPMGYDCLLNVWPLSPGFVGPVPLFPIGGTGPGNGSISFPGAIPVTTSPGSIALQAFVLDAGVSAGFSNTNGVEMLIQ
ncbi:MAG: hypothetical protein HY812_05145 [Planctomycetes bacterium]|nr:hypothetical protein [Planctomycetota bacterium]